MPKQTFLNLPDEKRQKILEVAIEEFAQNLYVNASITKIAEKAGVAKGSMYQYFTDKKDLYQHLLELIGQRKMEFMNDVILQIDKLDFISLMRLMFQKGLEFAISNPDLAMIGNNFIKEQNSEIRDDILKDVRKKSNAFFVGIIDRAKERGDIRSEISSEMGASIIYYFNNLLLEWIDLPRISQRDQGSIENYMEKVDAMLEIMKHGYQK